MIDGFCPSLGLRMHPFLCSCSTILNVASWSFGLRSTCHTMQQHSSAVLEASSMAPGMALVGVKVLELEGADLKTWPKLHQNWSFLGRLPRYWPLPFSCLCSGRFWSRRLGPTNMNTTPRPAWTDPPATLPRWWRCAKRANLNWEVELSTRSAVKCCQWPKHADGSDRLRLHSETRLGRAVSFYHSKIQFQGESDATLADLSSVKLLI